MSAAAREQAARYGPRRVPRALGERPPGGGRAQAAAHADRGRRARADAAAPAGSGRSTLARRRCASAGPRASSTRRGCGSTPCTQRRGRRLPLEVERAGDGFSVAAKPARGALPAEARAGCGSAHVAQLGLGDGVAQLPDGDELRPGPAAWSARAAGAPALALRRELRLPRLDAVGPVEQPGPAPRRARRHRRPALGDRRAVGADEVVQDLELAQAERLHERQRRAAEALARAGARGRARARRR